MPQPYVIVFVGINGVGKSTSLSKVAFHLRDHGHSVLIAGELPVTDSQMQCARRGCVRLWILRAIHVIEPKSTFLSNVISLNLFTRYPPLFLAACDSFRAGAVEQLKRHCTALDVPLFQQGYAKDPVTIASAAIKEATDARMDCVLVDTAGRMQNNGPLMQQVRGL